MWMHNGNVGGWKYVKRRLVSSIGDQWFLDVQGGTDSEWAFALFLDSMDKMGHNPSVEPGDGGFGHTILRNAVLRTIRRINELIEAIPKEHKSEADCETRSLLNFAVSDGHSVVCSRYVSSKTDEAASLYFSSGTNWKRHSLPGNYKMERRDKGADIVLVASEPLTFERDNWVRVPTNSTLTIHKQTVLVHPIIDQYYNPNPSFERSSGYAESKGLVSNEPESTATSTDVESLILDIKRDPAPLMLPKDPSLEDEKAAGV
ncbi:MAG: hypothetical protein M1836_007702 [Candelina mexicana]|nr:MAG: hypothetical protein M1836_007702 [Candelina mexicana]